MDISLNLQKFQILNNPKQIIDLHKGFSKTYYFFMTSPLIPLLYERKGMVFREAHKLNIIYTATEVSYIRQYSHCT